MLELHRMPYYLHTPDPKVFIAANLEDYARVPFLHQTEVGFFALGNRFLVALKNGTWAVTRCGIKQGGRSKSYQTALTYGRAMVNFLSWCEAAGKALETIDYQLDLVKGYQADIASGAWSRRGLPNQNQTANAYTQIACNFLDWMTEQGLRDSLNVIYVPTQIPYTDKYSGNTRMKTAYVRKGSLNASAPKKISLMPSKAEFNRWKEDFHKLHGDTLLLILDTATDTALRASMLSSLRADDIPDDEALWTLANPESPLTEQEIIVQLKYGRKGPDEGFCPLTNDKIASPQELRVPVLLARRLNDYKRGPRLDALERLAASIKNKAARRRALEASVHMFLDPKTGEHFTAKDIYNAWTHPALKPPAAHWTVHSARHWWACQAILQHWLKRFSSNPRQLIGDARAMLGTLEFIIDFRVRPQLGHVSAATTQIYLRWLRGTLLSDEHLDFEIDLETFTDALPEDYI